MKNTFWLIGIFISLCILLVLCFINIKSIDLKIVKTLWANLTFLSDTIFALIPLILLVILVTLILTKKWVLRVEKLSFGGINFLFDKPSELFRRQVRTFLDTKRTLFKIDFNHDNFDETLDSYFNTYNFLREEIKILGNVKKRKKGSQKRQLYELSNEMIKELNTFLTKHQTNYRRWYKYKEIINKEQFYLKPIGELQKEYTDYDELSKDFKEINNFFNKRIATEFEINIRKWGK